jgi:hypothetical protein
MLVPQLSISGHATHAINASSGLEFKSGSINGLQLSITTHAQFSNRVPEKWMTSIGINLFKPRVRLANQGVNFVSPLHPPQPVVDYASGHG